MRNFGYDYSTGKAVYLYSKKINNRNIYEMVRNVGDKKLKLTQNAFSEYKRNFTKRVVNNLGTIQPDIVLR